MNLHEFELRYRSFKGLSHKFDLDWNQETLLDMVKITNKGQLVKSLQDTSPVELHEITVETYTPFKQAFLENNKETTIGHSNLADYIERLEYELKVIKEMGFNSYFLIVADFVRRAKKNTIVVGPGRGSGAGSLLAWLIRITEVDPLPFGLLFERFLNPARVSMPDFDIDFEDTQREKVIQYVTQKYGADKVSYIGTYMQLATKAAFKDVARALGIPFEKSNQISSLIPDKIGLLDAINMPNENEELKSFYNGDAVVQRTVKLANKLEGNMRQLGVHACGMIIAPDVITKYTPVQYAKEDDHNIVSQYDGPALETIGLLKMDFLGLRNLSVIKNCIKIIQKKCERKQTPLPQIFQDFFANTSFLPELDDMYTFKKVFQSGDTTGIFQFESDGMRSFLIKLKADSINDLVAMNALYRPGPMEFIPNYIARKNGEEPVTYMHTDLRNALTKLYSAEVADDENRKLVEDLAPIMNLTYGIAVYQEQLMFLVQAMAGFSLAEADLLRRGIGKKKKEVIEQLKKEFVKRCEEYKEYKKETSIYIYEKMIEPAASYSFNKSHSVCYALIAYQTAYLKAHYPVEFYAALIRSVEEDTDELRNYIAETQNHGIKVQTTDINESFNHVAAIEDEIRLGFFCVRGIGMEVGEFIQSEREKNGAFTSLENFITRCNTIINKKSLEGLIKSGGLDSFGDRKTMLEEIDTLLQRSKSSPNNANSLFGMMEIANTISFKKTYTTSFMERLYMEQDVYKSFVSGHPLDGLYPYIKKYNFISQFKNEEAFGYFIIVGYIKNIQRAKKKGFFVQIEDISGTIEIFVRDTLDFQKFDILIISGFKGKSVSIEKIIRTSRDILMQQAGSKYDPEVTVIQAKRLRMQNNAPIPEPAAPKNTSFNEGEQNIGEDDGFHQEENHIEEQIQEEAPQQVEFPLPDAIHKINELLYITQQHPGDIMIHIGKKQVGVDSSGLEKIQALYK